MNDSTVFESDPRDGRPWTIEKINNLEFPIVPLDEMTRRELTHGIWRTSMIRPITIGAVLNGFKVQVGCQEVVFTSVNDLLSNLAGYLEKPQQFEERFLASALNRRHTYAAGPEEPSGMIAGGCEVDPQLRNLTVNEKCCDTPRPPNQGYNGSRR